jgi:hypothetical protein
MSDPLPHQPVLPSSWVHVLEAIERSLDQAIAGATEPPPAPPPPAPADPPLHDRLTRLKDCLARAERDTAALTAQLDAGADSCRRWLATAAVVRQHLADRPPVGI